MAYFAYFICSHPPFIFAVRIGFRNINFKFAEITAGFARRAFWKSFSCYASQIPLCKHWFSL